MFRKNTPAHKIIIKSQITQKVINPYRIHVLKRNRLSLDGSSVLHGLSKGQEPLQPAAGLVPSFPEHVGQLRLATPHCAMFTPPPTLVKLRQVKVFRVLYISEPRTPDELYFEKGVTI